MQLVHNWRSVLARAWSLWGLYLVAALTAIEGALPTISVPWWVKFGIIALAAIMRLVKQQSLSK